jgi:hypothetical protein
LSGRNSSIEYGKPLNDRQQRRAASSPSSRLNHKLVTFNLPFSFQVPQPQLLPSVLAALSPTLKSSSVTPGTTTGAVVADEEDGIGLRELLSLCADVPSK